MNDMLIDVVVILSRLLTLLIIARAVMSWISPNPDNPVVALIHRVTEPLLAPVRNLLPVAGGMDFSPIVVLLGIQVLESVLLRLLSGY
jgi:YggT family protein